MAPAIAWAQPQPGQARWASIVGPHLVLMDASSVMVCRLDLPLPAWRLHPGASSWLGAIGQRALFINGHVLMVVNLATGELSQHPIPLITDAMIDGPHVLLATRNGIVTINPHTGKQLPITPWPAELRDRKLSPNRPWASGNFLSNGMSYATQPGPQPVVPSAMTAADGVLYVRYGPTRLVALEAGDE